MLYFLCMFCTIVFNAHCQYKIVNNSTFPYRQLKWQTKTWTDTTMHLISEFQNHQTVQFVFFDMCSSLVMVLQCIINLLRLLRLTSQGQFSHGRLFHVLQKLRHYPLHFAMRGEGFGVSSWVGLDIDCIYTLHFVLSFACLDVGMTRKMLGCRH